MTRWLPWLIQRKTALRLKTKSASPHNVAAEPNRQIMADKYSPLDQLFLWWLGEPALPRLVGELGLAGGRRAVSLRYSADWLRSGFALSEDLPLLGELFVPRDKDCAAGAVDDARPDRWGERVIRKFELTPRLSIRQHLMWCPAPRVWVIRPC